MRATPREKPSENDLAACCAVFYGSTAVRWVLGDSFHPGGLALTARLAALMDITPSSHVLDAGSGTGASAVHLAKTLGCRVTGVTLEDEGVRSGRELARRHGVEDRTEFRQGDIDALDGGAQRFDFVLMECVLSSLGNRAAALDSVHGALKPGGRLGLTDVTVSGPLPQELQSVLATVGCVGGALPPAGYRGLLEELGFATEHTEDCGPDADSFLRGISGKLLMAKVASKLGILPIGEPALAEAGQLLDLAREQVQRGVLGYTLLVARKLA